jgi:ferredoxin-thioredoxin reductase catalytic subunit
MSTPWTLYNEVIQNNNLDYNVYRCPEPTATKTEEPWFPRYNACPCDPKLSNITGRGYTACPIGLNEERQIPNGNNPDIVTNPRLTGTLFNQKQWVPPQIYPNPSIRIGEAWRTVN